MDETVYKVAMAGFFHDIGKLADREILGVSQGYIDNHSGLYLPFKDGHYTHHHAVYTAFFIEQMKDCLPDEFNRPGWGEGDSFINLAAGHHKPETPLQWVVATADRVSSGFDRAEFDEKYNKAVAPKDYRKNRLVPIFEHLSEHPKTPLQSSEDYSYCYPLQEITPEGIFPDLKARVYPKDNHEATEAYRKLYDGFVHGLKGLYHRQENLALWFEHAESLVMRYASSVPAARAGHVIPDVSLYDHLKTTAALASALYLYHSQTDTLTVEAIQRPDTKRFLLISGDFYGIQDFIFSSGQVQKNRSKMLRGRSFAVSLFSELAADLVCREIGIPSVAIILNAAGRFTLIAPNTAYTRNALSAAERRINQWLMAVSFGETSMGISHVEASSEDFVKGRFKSVWVAFQQRIERKKYTKFDLSTFGGPVSGYLDAFNNDLAHPLCPFCGKRPSHLRAEGSRFPGDQTSACGLCRDHIYLGENLVKNALLAITDKAADIQGGDENRLLEPIFGRYQVTFLNGALNEMAREGSLLKHWDVSQNRDGKIFPNVTSRFINGYVPVYSEADLEDDRLLGGKKGEAGKLERIDQVVPGMPKTFTHIANKSLALTDDKCLGVEAVGVLKADVDNLGLLISCGLPEQLFTLSRMATLSRQLNSYFSVYLPWLLESEPVFHDVYTVFAGGDDLFLIGPWNRMVPLAERIRTRFSGYVCNNPEIHLSAGVSVYKPNTPVGFMAEAAKTAITAAKEGGRNRMTVFEQTVTWKEMERLCGIQEELEDWLEKNWIDAAMLYRLNEVMKMVGEEQRLVKENQIHLADMACTRWRALLSYSVGRNAGKGLPPEERRPVVDRISKLLNQWLIDFGPKMKIPLWTVLYNRRTVNF